MTTAALFPGFAISEADTVVDVGSGPGGDCLFAGRLGAEVVAIDIDVPALERLTEAMRSVPARSFRALPIRENEPLPLPEGTASVVIAREVLEHVDDPPRFLAELVRIGRPGARYLITVPDPASETILRLVAPPEYWRKPFHQHIFEHEHLQALVRDAGLTIASHAPCNFHGSMWWILNWSVGANHYPGCPDPVPPILADWERVWTALSQTPQGPLVMQALDRLLPKSQVVIARKPEGAPRVWRRWKPLARTIYRRASRAVRGRAAAAA